VSGVLRIAILGSTGSIGRQALDVVARSGGRVQVVALAADSNHDVLVEQARAFKPQAVALATPEAAFQARRALSTAEVGSGPDAVAELARHPEVDLVLNALVGAAGLRATMNALDSSTRLALANKESLVVGGELVTSHARPGDILPVDSEHSAIFQCLLGEPAEDVSRIWLTASGGPFRGKSRDELAHVDAAQALAHPTWTMGPKITIDSATLMNKGLEAIEAHHLFDIPYDCIRIVVHPQSCVHSMVEYADGSVKAHLGATDMRIPIQYALSYPRRWAAPVEPIDFTQLGSLDFEPPDMETFRCLALALAAGEEGGTMPAAMNAANEVAVAAFLAGQCRLTDIDGIVESVLDDHEREPLTSIDQVEAVDAWARTLAAAMIARL
jgi:1-deoxy-D-xylulose-5-phosphate reductoisomerase